MMRRASGLWLQCLRQLASSSPWGWHATLSPASLSSQLACTQACSRLWSSSSGSSSSEPVTVQPGILDAVSTPGQPVPCTHPHLLREGELTPGIQASEYAARRSRLASALPAGSIVVLPSASTTYMSGVIPYPYRQDPDFWYLTGLHQHGVAVLQAGNAPGECTFTLFIEPSDPVRTRWDGARVDTIAAAHVFGADEVHFTDQLPGQLTTMLRKASEVFFDIDRPSNHQNMELKALITSQLSARSTQRRQQQQAAAFERQLQTTLGLGGQDTYVAAASNRFHPLRPLLHAMRLQKSAAEVLLMRASARLAGSGIQRCMTLSHPGVSEHALAASFEYECKRHGASRMAFPQVVAGGPDACTIHYGRNDKLVAGGQLLLMDAGCELHGYCSDVTRTWPVSGRFTPAQRAVYDVVLSVHNRCIAACKPGSSLRQLHSLAVQLLSEGLVDLGVTRGAPLSEVTGGLYRDYYWHALGHWLGLDTHDVHLMGHDRLLQPGYVITIEPGLYIPNEPAYGHLRGIGVRIEDDVLVTPEGCEVLSSTVPHAADEVEALVGSQLQHKH